MVISASREGPARLNQRAIMAEARVRKLEAENQELLSRLEGLEGSGAPAPSQGDPIDARLQAAQVELEAARLESQRLAGRVSELEVELSQSLVRVETDADSQLQALEQARKAAESQVQALQTRLNQASLIVQSRDARIRELEAAAGAAAGAGASATGSEASKTGDSVETTKLRLLEQELKESVARIADLEQQVRTGQEELTLSTQAVEQALLGTREAEDRCREAERRAQEAEHKLRQAGGSGKLPTIRAGSGDHDHRILEARQQLLEAEERSREMEEKLRLAMQQIDSERAAAERLAYQDQLTGLANLNLFTQVLDMAVRSARNRETTIALLLLDLDRFQSVNRLVGYPAGNQLLKAVADRIKPMLPKDGVLARRGEDEFLILVSLPNARSNSPVAPANAGVLARNFAQQIQQALNAPFMIEDRPIILGVTIGISTCPGDADTASEMLEHADSALHGAKETGRGRFLFYTQDMAQESERKLHLETDLRKALELKEFEVLYQPVVEIPRGLLVGATAHLVWNHPQRGLQNPDDYWPVAERSGLAIELGSWALQQACDQIRRMKSGFICVKLSTRQMLDPGLGPAIAKAIGEARLTNPESLVLTVAESTLGDVPERFDQLVNQSSQWGVRFALSQTGTEFLSLRRLQSSPMKILRIARWIVDGVMHDETCSHLCRALIGLGKSLGLTTLAEGADSHAQVRFLAAHGCELAQGAFFKPPVSPDELIELKRQTWKI